MRARVRACVRACMRAWMRVRVCMHACMCMCACACVCVCVTLVLYKKKTIMADLLAKQYTKVFSKPEDTNLDPMMLFSDVKTWRMKDEQFSVEDIT